MSSHRDPGEPSPHEPSPGEPAPRDPSSDESRSGSGDSPLVAPGSDALEPVAPGGAPAERSDPESSSAEPPVAERTEQPRRRSDSPNMLPAREVRRSGIERLLVRLIATCGIVGIGVAVAAIMVSSNSQGWLIGLVVSIVSVILAALLWSSRML